MEQKKQYEIAGSPLKEAYNLLGANTPLELSNFYSIEDQKLMKSKEWNDYDSNLITNKIKDILEAVDAKSLTEEEKEWRQEILWFWYHHATSYAIFAKNDTEAAKEYVEKALAYQGEDHPNKITRLLYFLLHDQIDEAIKWTEEISEDEKDLANDLFEAYKQGKIL